MFTPNSPESLRPTTDAVPALKPNVWLTVVKFIAYTTVATLCLTYGGFIIAAAAGVSGLVSLPLVASIAKLAFGWMAACVAGLFAIAALSISNCVTTVRNYNKFKSSDMDVDSRPQHRGAVAKDTIHPLNDPEIKLDDQDGVAPVRRVRKAVDEQPQRGSSPALPWSLGDYHVLPFMINESDSQPAVPRFFPYSEIYEQSSMANSSHNQHVVPRPLTVRVPSPIIGAPVVGATTPTLQPVSSLFPRQVETDPTSSSPAPQ